MKNLHLHFGLAAALLMTVPCTVRADMPTFELVAEDGLLKPETIEVPAGTRFRLKVTNRNAGPEEFETATPFRELVLAPGVSRTTVYPPLKPGTYPFFGDFHKDTAKGRFIVK